MINWVRLYVTVGSVVFFLTNICAQDSLRGVPYSVDTLNNRDSHHKKNGWWEHRYIGNKLKSTIYYEHGKKQRWAHYYYRNGKLKETGAFKDNFKTNRWTYFRGKNLCKITYVTFKDKKIIEIVKLKHFNY